MLILKHQTLEQIVFTTMTTFGKDSKSCLMECVNINIIKLWAHHLFIGIKQQVYTNSLPLVVDD